MNWLFGSWKEKSPAFLQGRNGWLGGFLVLASILLGVSFLLWTGVRKWQERHTVTGLAVVVTRSGLNMREAPDEKSASYLVIPHGGQVEILGEERRRARINGVNGEWRYARYEKEEGWIFGPFNYLYPTIRTTGEMLVRLQQGTDLHSAPVLDSPIVVRLPFKASVKCLLQSVVVPDGQPSAWTFVESGGAYGYVNTSALSRVVYSSEEVANGPFEGMDTSGMPETYRHLEAGRISCSGAANPPDEEDCWVSKIGFAGDDFFVLTRGGKIRQIVGRRSSTPAGWSMVINSSRSVGLYCSDSELKTPAHFALVRSSLPEGSKDDAGNLRFSGVVHRFWVYDQGTNLMRAVEPSTKASCFLPNPRSFD